ncbi:uncharacterized protein MELLADRAFT_59997 [Melampsora larici-populina 98AG31]|uniref:RING-type domain-containing protein n=1 Tax=Melampsora larici-populina (strain 98AG31 / pathotype 3-4-7) TaxID=747676 RepID=F4R9L1_MELLP|nr:uncharacterized protein MELLADRAFT_59997 [Melampsora larici-populina 98AG31]EGG10999.1 hypothetical protein MELLADRAFT_59997 [Melampsora larici-populina 98AG31]
MDQDIINQDPNRTDETYKQLVKDLSTLQQTLDQVTTDPNETRVIPTAIQDALSTEMMEAMMNGFLYVGNPAALANLASRRNRSLYDSLRSMPETGNLNLSAIDRIPSLAVESDAWSGLLIYSRLSSEHCHVFRSQPDVKEDDREECSICITNFEDGQRYVQFPCHKSHKICEKECFTNLAASLYIISCPFCRKIPFDE